MRRVNQVLREVISEAITSELSDPRLEMTTVTAVDTTPDLQYAKVYVTTLGDEQAKEDALAGLKSAHSLLQHRIATGMRIKRTPALSFVYDDSVETGMRIDALLEAGSDGQDRDPGAGSSR